MTRLALVQNSTNSLSDSNATLGSHNSMTLMIDSSPLNSMTRAPMIPISAASSAIDMVGFNPLLDSLSHLPFSSPGMWVTSLTSTSAAMHNNVQTIAAFVTMEPLGRSPCLQHLDIVKIGRR